MTPYSGEFDPPAPVLQIIVAGVVHMRPRVTVPALLDTGADLTAIPANLVDRLKLYQIGRLTVEGISGQTTIAPTYVARLTVAGQVIPEHKVLLTGLDFAVIGRDLINQFYIALNGPTQTFDVGNTPYT